METRTTKCIADVNKIILGTLCNFPISDYSGEGSPRLLLAIEPPETELPENKETIRKLRDVYEDLSVQNPMYLDFLNGLYDMYLTGEMQSGRTTANAYAELVLVHEEDFKRLVVSPRLGGVPLVFPRILFEVESPLTESNFAGVIEVGLNLTVEVWAESYMDSIVIKDFLIQDLKVGPCVYLGVVGATDDPTNSAEIFSAVEGGPAVGSAFKHVFTLQLGY